MNLLDRLKEALDTYTTTISSKVSYWCYILAVLCHIVLHYICSVFIHSDYFYSTSSSLLLLRSAPDTARILCRSVTPKRHWQLQSKACKGLAQQGPYVAGCNVNLRKLLSANKSNARETSLFTGSTCIPNPVRNSKTSRFVSVPD